MLPREESSTDKLVFLGDLIDRGPDVPGCVEHVLNLCTGNPEQVLYACFWKSRADVTGFSRRRKHALDAETVTGEDRTFEQYTATPLRLNTDADFVAARNLISQKIPATQIKFLRQLPLYHEDDFALYVHAQIGAGQASAREFAPCFALDARHGFLQELSPGSRACLVTRPLRSCHYAAV